jgi:hypothetical protein
MKRIITVMLGALLLVGLAAGCGVDATADDVASVADSPSGDSDGAGTTTTVVDPKEAMLQFAQCMRDHGVDMPDPTEGSGGGVVMKGPTGDKNAVDEADEACASLRPKAGDGGMKPDPEQEAKMREQALAFSACMREHGIDMPDPQFGDGSMSMSLGDGIDPEAPAFKEAQAACESLMQPPEGARTEGGPGDGPVVAGGGGPGFSTSGSDQ